MFSKGFSKTATGNPAPQMASGAAQAKRMPNKMPAMTGGNSPQVPNAPPMQPVGDTGKMGS